MQTQLFPPHPQLAHLLMHVLVVELDGCESHLCASLNPSVMLMARGGVDIVQDDGSLVPAPRFLVRGPFAVPARSRARPGTLALSVCFRAGMLHQATGLHPADLLSGYLPVQDLADPALVAQFLAAVDAAPTTESIVALLQEFLLKVLDHRKKPGMGAAFLAAHQKMFMPLLDLSLHFGIGQRQLERRVREAFGVPLRETRRISRFGFTILRIAGQNPSWGDLTRIAHDSGYYDQAHMHKDFVELAGHTPIQLLQKIASNDPAYWLYRLSEEDMKKLFLPTN